MRTLYIIRLRLIVTLTVCIIEAGASLCFAQPATDPIRELQAGAIKNGRATWGYWGTPSGGYYDWCNHSNRLVPVYTFGFNLSSIRGTKSVYRDKSELGRIYGRIPEGTLNPIADYFDQTDIYRLQIAAVEAGKKNIILMIFDGLDWHTTRAAAVYQSGGKMYSEGRGSGLLFQDYRAVETDFGFCVTSPHNNITELDVDSQRLVKAPPASTGGYDASLGGALPWDIPKDPGYLLGWNERRYHPPTDSANAATALVTGLKTYNGAINFDHTGRQLQTMAHLAQSRYQRAVGVVTSVPISNATPAAAYAHNVSRLDYQDLVRDLVGLPSISHPHEPLPGVDVLLGTGWRDTSESDPDQGMNFVPGNKHLSDHDRQQIDAKHGGAYVIVERKEGQRGAVVLDEAGREAEQRQKRLLGIFGGTSEHLPYQTANGDYQPTVGVSPAESYTPADISENPTLADMTRTALTRLASNPNGFWLMVEAGDVDLASHDANIDNAIGAILSGDEAFRAISTWAEQNDAWQETIVIVTSDHGHGFVLTDSTRFGQAGSPK